MNLSELHAATAVHKHAGTARPDRAFPVVLVMSFLVLSACAGFAVIMTNGPDYRAAAAPVPTPVISGGTSLTFGGDGTDPTVENLTFAAAMPQGPLVIGEPGRLVVTIGNPHAHAVRLDRLDVRVQQPSDPECRAEWLSVGEYSADDAVTIPAGESARISLPYTLVDLVGTNQDACKGANFPLSITGSGRPV